MNRLPPSLGNRERLPHEAMPHGPPSVTEKVRVVVGDDHPLFRDGLVSALAASGRIDVVAEAGDGTSMAKELHLAPSTVKTHVQRLYEKLGVADRATAVAEAMRRKLLE